jgi:hypothetical protein
METISIKQIMRIFYRDKEFKKLKWEQLKDVEEIELNLESLGIEIPTNEFEFKDFDTKVRQALYRWAEWDENGRIVVKIKFTKGSSVKYGVTKNQKLLMQNSLTIHKRRLNADRKDNLISSQTRNMLDKNNTNKLNAAFNEALIEETEE